VNAIQRDTAQNFPITKQQGQKEVRREAGNYLKGGVQ